MKLTKFVPHHMYAPVTNECLRRLVPSAFAESAHTRTSDSYSFFPTIKVIDGLRKAGWEPVFAAEQTIRAEHRQGFQKHMLRFCRVDDFNRAGEERPEMILLNSHDASSAYQLHAGVFRFVCANGMILADTTFNKVSVRHTNLTPDAVVEASLKIVAEIPRIGEQVEEFRARQLTDRERLAFATGALTLKYDEPAKAPIAAQTLLKTRRYEDSKPTLWNTLNTVQENVIDGGLRDLSKRKAGGGLFPRTRGVKGIDENVKLNKALWAMAEVLKG